MRTTLDIDEPLLNAVRSRAAQTGQSLGRVVSDLIARALQSDEVRAPGPEQTATATRNGFVVVPRRSGASPVTMEFVNRLRDAEDE